MTELPYVDSFDPEEKDGVGLTLDEREQRHYLHTDTTGSAIQCNTG
jgi:hypothetical protein